MLKKDAKRHPPPETIAAAKRLAVPPQGHRPRGLRVIAQLLAEGGHTPRGKPTGNRYSHEAVRRMLKA